MKKYLLFTFLLVLSAPFVMAQESTNDSLIDNADKVISRYISALGGAEKLQQVEDLEIQMHTSYQGLSMKLEVAMKVPNLASTVVLVNGLEMSKEVYDGTKSVTIARGEAKEKDARQTKDAAIKSLMWPELHYEKYGVKTYLEGVEKIKDQEAYAVRVVFPTGTTATHFFDKKTGLKIRESVSVEGPESTVTFNTDLKDYLDVDGILFPHTTLIPLGADILEAKVTSIHINQGLRDDLFKA